MAKTRNDGPKGVEAKALAGAFLIQKNVRTLGASVANTLRDAIVSGQLAPGQALGQELLAGLFGVSRVPVREALKQERPRRCTPSRQGAGSGCSRFHWPRCSRRGGAASALRGPKNR